MKSRVSTYILIVAVVVIWAAIAYRVYDATTTKASVAIPQSTAPNSVKSNSDTLYLNYRDPFLGAGVKKAVVSSAPRILNIKQKNEQVREKINIKYTARLSSAGREFSVLEFTGGQEILAVGDTMNGVKLLKIFDDSVHIQKRGLNYTIKLNR